MPEIKEITADLINFRNDRDWGKYHTPRNLAESISLESAELLKCFQWGQAPDYQAVQDEIADVAIYLLYICDSLDIDLRQAIYQKIIKNSGKYPVGERHEW